MHSSWEQTKLKSKYHFKNDFFDPQIDRVIRLGKLKLNIQNELEEIVKNAKPATWRTRTSPNKPRNEIELATEEYDLEKFGYGKEFEVSHLNWDIPTVLKKVSKLFALEDCMERIHVQMPGEVWNLHIDKLEKWNPNDLDSIVRFQIALTDWQQGQFWSYGNYMHSMWKTGDVTSFDWQNLPHSTANASHYPRVTLQLTGVQTIKTKEFLRQLITMPELDIDKYNI